MTKQIRLLYHPHFLLYEFRIETVNEKDGIIKPVTEWFTGTSGLETTKNYARKKLGDFTFVHD